MFWKSVFCLYISPAHPSLQLSSVQFSCSVVSDSVTEWTAACPASLSITNSWSLLKLMSTESVMPPNDLTLCHPLLLLPSIFPSIWAFSNESVFHISPSRWPLIFHISIVCLFQNVLWSELYRMQSFALFLDYLSFINMHLRFHGLIAHSFLLLNNIPL